MERVIDLRSDTVSLPSKDMIETILAAPLGDDVYGEDPTANALQEKVAKLLGKEAALFVPSGTMGNLICVLNHCQRRDSEVIVGDQSHIHIYEQGGIAQLGSVHSRTVKNLPDGTFSIEEMETLVRGKNNSHFPVTSLVCIENTHNIAGGPALPLEWIDQVGKKCKELDLPLHVDGARIFNSAIALNVPVERLVRDASSVNICISKGLGAPIGSVIAGSKEFIDRAVRIRKVLGGGMRQVGVLAAMCNYAIDHATQTIRRDHKHLAMIAEGITDLRIEDFISIDNHGPLTNMLFLIINKSIMTPSQFYERMKNYTEEEHKTLHEKIICKMNIVAPLSKIRMVTNNTIKEDDVHMLIKKIKFIVEDIRARQNMNCDVE